MQQLVYPPKQLLEVSDNNLAEQTIAGCHDAFEILIDRYRHMLFHLISCYLSDYDQACDVLQQVFLQLYISLPTIAMRQTLKPWLLRVAQNRCRDELRMIRRRQTSRFSDFECQANEDDLSPLTTIPDPGPSLEEIAEYHDMQERLQCAIQASLKLDGS